MFSYLSFYDIMSEANVIAYKGGTYNENVRFNREEKTGVRT